MQMPQQEEHRERSDADKRSDETATDPNVSRFPTKDFRAC